MHRRHYAARRELRDFAGPVVPADHPRYRPAAHGGITIIQHCACGLERRMNYNHGRCERGDWGRPLHGRKDQP